MVRALRQKVLRTVGSVATDMAIAAERQYRQEVAHGLMQAGLHHSLQDHCVTSRATAYITQRGPASQK